MTEPTPRERKSRPKTRQTDARWREILDATAEIFAKQGYEATGVRDVAEAVGMLSGSLYYYIDTKEDLLYALIVDFHEQGRTAMQDLMDAAGDDPLVTLRAVLALHGALNAKNVARSAVFYSEFRHLGHDRKVEIVASRRSQEDRIQGLLEEAQARGEVKAGLDAKVTALAMVSMLNASHTWYRSGIDLTPEEIGELQADLLLNGVATVPGG